MSNYPDGMTRSDWDHVEGITRCIDCGADITAALEDLPADEWTEMCATGDFTCPSGCAGDREADRGYDMEGDR